MRLSRRALVVLLAVALVGGGLAAPAAARSLEDILKAGRSGLA